MSAYPEIIKKYLSIVASNADLKYSHVSFQQQGIFFMSPESKGRRFKAREVVSLKHPEFVWKANMSMYKLPILVSDELRHNKGRITAKIFSLFPLMDIEDEEILVGELIRYLAEIPWYPQALYSLKNLKFEILTANKVKTTIFFGKLKASVVYEFDEGGLISSVTSDGRFMEVDGKKVNYPWGGKFSHYHDFEDVIIPEYGEAYWDLPEGRFTYFTCSLHNYESQ